MGLSFCSCVIFVDDLSFARFILAFIIIIVTLRLWAYLRSHVGFVIYFFYVAMFRENMRVNIINCSRICKSVYILCIIFNQLFSFTENFRNL